MDHRLAKLYRAPDLADAELTGQRVRDELVRCFVSALSCVPTPPGADPIPPRAMVAQVQGFVRQSFASVGVGWDSPTQAAILQAMSKCRDRADQMHVPANDVQRHWSEMMKLVDRLP